jgi:DNA-binding response OmpR family regulator
MRLLLVEDEVGIASFLRQGLEEEGFQVEVAFDGATGLSLALNQPFDLLLLDWMLPEVSGLEICRQVRESDSSTPILFLTAKDTAEEAVLGLKTGANDYIRKPFHFEELLQRIQVQLRGSSTSSVLTLGDILVDLKARKVARKNVPISLTTREFDLLTYLVQNAGAVCTRTQILADVWDIHFDYDSGVIDVHINALRRKLGLENNHTLIHTVRGVGYKAHAE